MDTSLLLWGFIAGFSVAAPVGPIAVLCIRRTLTDGRVFGFVSGLGAATADAVYGCMAGLGLTLVSDFLVSQQLWLRLFGGGFLCLLGLRAVLSTPSEQTPSVRGKGLIGAYASTFFLTVTHPLTILSFAAVFAGLGAGGPNVDYFSAMVLVLGVFFGSSTWWFILSWAVSVIRSKSNSNWLLWGNRVSGMILTGFGLIVLLSLIG